MNRLLLAVDVLSPGRRRRRYYLIEAIRYMRPYYGTQRELATALGATESEVVAWLRGETMIPLWTRAMAVAVYHVPRPPWFLIYGPLTMSAAIVLALITVLVVR